MKVLGVSASDVSMKEQYFRAASMKLVNSFVAIILDTNILSEIDNVFSIAVIK